MNFMPVFPILPTPEAETMSFLQKLEFLNYKVTKDEKKLSDLEKKIVDLATINAEGDSEGYLVTLTINETTYRIPNNGVITPTADEQGNLVSLEIDGTTYTIPPEGSVVSATDDGEGNLRTITVDGTTYDVAAGGSVVSCAFDSSNMVTSITIDGVTHYVANVKALTYEGSLTGLVIDGSYYMLPEIEGSDVTATGTGGVIETITIDGDTWNVPQGTPVTASGAGTNLEHLTIDGTTWDVPQPVEEVKKGFVTFIDGGLHTGICWYNLVGSLLTLKLGDMSAMTGNTFYINNLPGTGAIAARCPFSVTRYTQIDGAVIISGILTISRPANSATTTLTVDADEDYMVTKIASDGTITSAVATADDFKALSWLPLSFMI